MRLMNRFVHRIQGASHSIVKFLTVPFLIKVSPQKQWEVGTDPKKIERNCDEEQRGVAIILPLFASYLGIPPTTT